MQGNWSSTETPLNSAPFETREPNKRLEKMAKQSSPDSEAAMTLRKRR